MSISVSFVSPNLVEYHFSLCSTGSLLFLHSCDHSMQWPLDQIGVILEPVNNELFKIGLMTVGISSYQSFLVRIENFNSVHSFFKSLGFPLYGSELISDAMNNVSRMNNKTII